MNSSFGNTAGTNPSSYTGFGSSTTQNQPSQGPGLFGSSTTQNQPSQGPGLFGASTANPSAPAASSSIFGGNATQTQPTQSTNLFSAGAPPTNAPTGNNSLFGANTWNPSSGSTSLFGAGVPPPNPTQNSWAERTFTNPQPAFIASTLQSGLGGPSHLGALGAADQQDLARSRLEGAGVLARRNEKSQMQLIQSLVRKWDPSSQDTLMQTYLYNAVNAAYAPFYYKNADENEKEWEAALAAKPAPVENKDGSGSVSFVPIIVRGFHALGERMEYQARTVKEMRGRLHEMNNSLNAVMVRHQQSLTVRMEGARRRHVELSERCLRLAVKAQVYRERGRPLDAMEEGLRRTLMGLEKAVLDPAFAGREEEIWARMLALRERARWLEEEGKRLGKRVEGSQKGVPEEVVRKTKRVLKDYDGQLAHLGKELEGVRGEFEAWEGSLRG